MRVIVGRDEEATRARCILNGIDISTRCWGADEELGEVYCFVKDEAGHFIRDRDPRCDRMEYAPDCACGVRKETLYGKVEIIID